MQCIKRLYLLYHVTHTRKADLEHLWGEDRGRPSTPAQFFLPPYPRPLFPYLLFSGTLRPKFKFFTPRPSAPRPLPIFRQKPPYPRPAYPGAPVPPVLPHISGGLIDNRSGNLWSMRHWKLQKYSTWLKTIVETNQLQCCTTDADCMRVILRGSSKETKFKDKNASI